MFSCFKETKRGKEGRATSSSKRNAQHTRDIETSASSPHTTVKLAPTCRYCSVNN